VLGASDFKQDDFPKAESVQMGWYYFNKGGKLIKSGKKETVSSNGITYYTGGVYSTAGDKFLPASDQKKVGDNSLPIGDDEYDSRWMD
jgi:hypothetical protein